MVVFLFLFFTIKYLAMVIIIMMIISPIAMRYTNCFWKSSVIIFQILVYFFFCFHHCTQSIVISLDSLLCSEMYGTIVSWFTPTIINTAFARIVFTFIVDAQNLLLRPNLLTDIRSDIVYVKFDHRNETTIGPAVLSITLLCS